MCPLWKSNENFVLVYGLVVVLVVVLLEFEDEYKDDDEHDVPG